jgi:hypothetical protein
MLEMLHLLPLCTCIVVIIPSVYLANYRVLTIVVDLIIINLLFTLDLITIVLASFLLELQQSPLCSLTFKDQWSVLPLYS